MNRLSVVLGIIAVVAAGHSARGAEQVPKAADLGTRSQGEDWPCFLGPRHDSRSTETGILTTWPEKGPPIVWQTHLGEGYGAPSISKGRLLHFDRYGDQARVVCRESETGDELWRFEYETNYQDLYGYNNGPRCCPVIEEDRVYVFGVEGMLHCLQLVDGREIWKVDTQEEFGVVQNFFGVGSTPIVEGDLLIVQVGGSTDASRNIPPGQLDRVKGDGTGIVAFDRRTGEVRYAITDSLASYSSPVIATIGQRRWCFVFARGGLVGFDPENGAVDFHFPWYAKILESVNAANPVVIGDRVFISETYGPGSALLQVRPGGFLTVWQDDPRRRDKAMQTHWNTCIHHEGYLYGSSGRHQHDAELRCIDVETGDVKWSVGGASRSSLLYADGHLVCLTEDGLLALLRATPEKLEIAASVVLRGEGPERAPGLGPPRLLRPPTWAAPVLSHGLLYVRGKDRLVCLELIPQ